MTTQIKKSTSPSACLVDLLNDAALVELKLNKAREIAKYLDENCAVLYTVILDVDLNMVVLNYTCNRPVIEYFKELINRKFFVLECLDDDTQTVGEIDTELASGWSVSIHYCEASI